MMTTLPLAAVAGVPAGKEDGVISQPGHAVLTTADETRLKLLYHFSRLQLPEIAFPERRFREQIERTYRLYAVKSAETGAVTWPTYLGGLYVLDWLVCMGCLDGLELAWERLFAARTGRSDALLVDALRGRACRLYPRDEEKQQSAVTEFWSSLLVPEEDHGTPILARYDGQRPLAPWLIRVFQNWHLSKLRRHVGVTSLPDEDIAVSLPPVASAADHWRDTFRQAARDWLHTLADNERLILGLRWRYKLSQREVANLLGVHEGTISRQSDKLRDRSVESIRDRMIEQGWDGDDLTDLMLTEMGGLLIDEPTLSADQLGRLLATKGKTLPR